jgi:hypothetical protein
MNSAIARKSWAIAETVKDISAPVLRRRRVGCWVQGHISRHRECLVHPDERLGSL